MIKNFASIDSKTVDGVTFYSKRAAVKDGYLVKYGNRWFGAFPSRDMCIKAAAKDGRHYYYEHLVNPTVYRFVLDIENKLEEVPSKEEGIQLLKNAVNEVCVCLAELAKPGQHEYHVYTASRWSDNMEYYKQSYHIIFPDVFVNSALAKSFAKRVSQVVSGVDESIYGSSVTMRFPFSLKEGGDPSSRLLYLNPDTHEVVPLSPEDRETALDRTLLGGQPSESSIVFVPSPVEPPAKKPRVELPVLEDPFDFEVIENGEYALKLLQWLKPSRAEDFQSWRDVGLVLAGAFRSTQRGLEAFIEFSRQAPNFDEQQCRRLYEHATGAGIKLLRDMAVKDAQLPKDDDSIDVDKVIDWVDLHLEHYSQTAKSQKERKLMTERFFRSPLFMPCMDYLNQFWCQIIHESSPVYLVRERGMWHHKSFLNFEKAYEEMIASGGTRIAKVWREHRAKKKYARLVFDPSTTESDRDLNLFTGFEYKQGCSSKTDEELAESVRPFVDHIGEVWANGDHAVQKLILQWFAHVLQKPWKRTNICIALTGTNGSGKSVVVDMMRQIIGTKHFQQPPPGGIGQRFSQDNSEMCVLMSGEEFFFAGDKKSESSLKTLITEQTRVVEKKYGAAMTFPNYINLICTSNNSWVVPAGLKARRFLALTTNNKYAGNTEYFQRLVAVDINDVAEFLYRLDVSDFVIGCVPMTQTLREQKLNSFDPVYSFLHNVLLDGELVLEDRQGERRFSWGSDYVSDGETAMMFNKQGSFYVRGDILYKCFVAFCNRQCKTRFQQTDSVFGQRVKQALSLEKGEYSRQIKSQNMKRYYVFPSLDELRDRFQNSLGDDRWFGNFKSDESDEWES